MRGQCRLSPEMHMATENSSPPFLAPLDVAALQHWQRVAAASASPWLHEEVGRRMQEKLDWIVRRPDAWCDWEPVRGGMQAHDALAARYPQSAVWVVHEQPAHQQVARQRWQGSRWSRLWGGKPQVHWGAPPDASVDMVWANMGLHQVADPQACMRQWAQWLRPDGFVMFSALGPDTLKELRALYAQQGWPPCAQDFVDMHDWGDMLLAQGFTEPIMDMEHVRLQYASAERLLQDLRAWGRNLHPARFAALRGKGWRQRLLDGLRGLADAQGNITVTFEIIYGHAVKAPPRMKVAGQTHISLGDMRQALKRKG